MSSNLSTPKPIVIPARKRRAGGIWLVLALLAAAGGYGAWESGFRPSRLWSRTPPPISTVEVDQGEIALVVTENGTLESSNNAKAICQVEAIIGLVGGAQNANGTNTRGGTQGGQGTQGTQGGMSGQSGQTTQQLQQTPTPTPTKTATKKAGSSSTAKATASTSKTGAAAKKQSDGPVAETPAAGAGGAGGAGGSGQSGTDATSTAIKKPTIRSFTYQVIAHVPLRPKTQTSATQKKTQKSVDPSMAGGGGSRGGSSGTQNQEKPGSTRIISILPEGTWVKAGDVVCELDSAAFQDELRAQKIRYAQAKAWVQQAGSLLEVSEITLREYRDGIYPQDVQLIRQYLVSCRTEEERARRTYEWSKETTAKGFRSAAQLQADALTLQQAEISLREAEGMEERLEKYTAPKLLKNLKAKIEAIRADKLAQEQAFELESDRLKKLEAMVAYCTMRAPGDGIVVYANQANRFGRVEQPIQEGVTVRQGQPIFYLPDPNHMQVRAKVNESKVSLIQSGQPVLVRIDAFHDRPLRGTVTEITPIPAPATSAEDVRVYYAVVRIDSPGFSELRPGLSAEVNFLVDVKPKVTRVPLQSVRWLDDRAYVAVAVEKASRQDAAKKKGPSLSYRWQRVELGMNNTTYIEVVSGLSPGEKLIAHPEKLPPPQDVEPRSNVAVRQARSRS